MKLQFSIGIGIAASLLSCLPAHAANLDLEVFKAIDTQDPNVRCPAKVVVTEIPQPYREGSFAIDGTANLSAIANGFTISSSDDFSVTWVGRLKPKYSQCKATARIVKSDNEDFLGHSYLRMRFVGGKAYLILDMTGMSDVNRLTTAILKKSVRGDKPIWSWGGTD